MRELILLLILASSTGFSQNGAYTSPPSSSSSGLPAGCTSPGAGQLTCTGTITAGSLVTTGSSPDIFGPIADPGSPATGSFWLSSTNAGRFKWWDGVAIQTAVGASTIDTLINKSIAETELTFSDILTNNVSTANHGFTPKLPNDATKYLDGTGAYSVPAGSGGAASVWFQPFEDRSSSVGFSADTLRACGFVLPYSVTFSKIMIYVNTADAGHNYSFGVFNSAGTQKAHTTPASLASTGSQDLSTVEGSQTLTSGKYYFGQTGASAPSALIAMSGTDYATFMNENTTGVGTSGGAMPASFSPGADSWVINGQCYTFALH